MASISIATIVDALDASAEAKKAAKAWSPNIARWAELYSCDRPELELNLVGGSFTRRRRTLGMGKRVPQDWAGLVWTERAGVEAGKPESLNDELMQRHFGPAFAPAFTDHLEGDVFAKGIGALEILIDGITVSAAGTVDFTGAELDVITVPAECIIPLKWRKGEVLECAFASIGQGIVDVREHREGPGDSWLITNRRFMVRGDGTQLTEVPAEMLIEEGIAPMMLIEGAPPMFAVMKPAIANNIDASSPYGMSVFANAEDHLEAVDVVFDNFVQDVFLGARMVGIPDTMLRKDANGNLIPPQRERKDLFIALTDPSGGGVSGDKSGIWDHVPSLRAAENQQALDLALSALSTAVGFGAERYRYRGETIATATQIISENSELYRNRASHLLSIKSALTSIARAVLWCYGNLLGENVEVDADIVIRVDDSVIEDDGARQARGIAKVQAGVMSLERYLTECEGLDEAAAKAEAALIQGSAPALF